LATRSPDLALLVGGSLFFELLDVLDKLKKAHTVTRIVVMLEQPEPLTVIAAFQHGVRGVLPLKQTSFATIRKCIRRVLEGQFWISTQHLTHVMKAFGQSPPFRTVRQVPPLRLGSRAAEVMGLASKGLSNKEIANTMHISEHTVKKHMRSLFRKVGVQGRVKLATYAADRRTS
jgi:DNA-binding NarL/FixJ family response regulator